MRYLLGILLAVYASAAMPALAGDCPAGGREEKLALIAKAPYCEEAARLFKLCAIGARLDGELAASANEVCEKTSFAKMTKKKREAYEAAISACNAPYAKKRGSINRSAAARCRVDVMEDYSKRQ